MLRVVFAALGACFQPHCCGRPIPQLYGIHFLGSVRAPATHLWFSPGRHASSLTIATIIPVLQPSACENVNAITRASTQLLVEALMQNAISYMVHALILGMHVPTV